MFHVVTLLCLLLVAPQLIISITVSPDVGLRNISSNNPIENKTINDLKLNSLTDRNRRLIPYMTFYIPQNEYPINQDYVPNPQQQQQQPQQHQPEEHDTNPSGHHQSQSSQNEQNQMIAIYQSTPLPPLNRLHHSQLQPQHQHHHQHHYPENLLHSSSLSSAGQSTAGTATLIPLRYKNPRVQQIYQQILYQDHGRNQLLKLKGNIPVNQQHHHQFPQQVHHSQQQHDIEGRLPLKENTLSKIKQQPQSVVHVYHHEQQQELPKTKLNSSPFTLFNKIPGHFTPIIYTNQGNNINYHENSQQYNDLLANGGGSTIVGSTENYDKQEENIYQIQHQQQQQKQLNKQEYYQYYHNHHHHNHPQQQQQQPEGNQNEQGILLSVSVEQQQQQQQQHQSQQLQQHQNHVGIVSSTQRPHFQVVSEKKHHYTPENYYHQKQEIESSAPSSLSPNGESLSANILTPQQKYVAYLQRQLRNKQQHRNQQQKHQVSNNYHQQIDAKDYLINSSALPSIAPPDNHINYHENHPLPPQRQHHHQYIYRQQPTKIDNNQEKEIVYVREDDRDRPSISETVQQTNQQHTQNHNFVEYIPEEHHQPSPPPQILSTVSPTTPSAHILPQNDKNLYKPILFVTTAATPILVTSVESNYKQHHQQTQHLHPIVNPTNLSEKPILNNNTTNIHRYNPQINQHKAPIFIVKPKLYLSKTNQQQQIQPIRQHLTETTQLPSPLLTSHRPYLSSNNRHYYNNRYYHKSSTQLTPLSSSTSSDIPIKLKPSQKFQPIVVTTLRPTTNLLNNDDIVETSSVPLIPKYEKHQPIQPIEIHRQPIEEIPLKHQQSQHYSGETINTLPDLKSNSLAEILRKLQDSNHLPQTITPNNIDNSIKTLIKILNNLKESQTINENPPQHHDEDYRDYDDTPVDNPDPSHRGPNSGRPGIDYPALYEIPQTNFNCKEQRYKGFFGDPETNCQVWHYCDLNGGQASFLCPNGTIFSQVALTCDWWFNVKCSSTAQLYVLNERLYKYILPFTPKFPEDYSGPLVDKYLALKFKEMEEKMTKEKLKGREKTEEYNEKDKTNESDEEGESKEDDNTKNITKNDDDEDDRSKEIDERSNATENQEIKSVGLEDVEENRGSVDTGITYNTISTSTTENSLTLKPIVVSSTTIEPPQYQSPQPTPFMRSSSTLRSQYKKQQKPRISVESEQVELIEIKSDGNSGHLIPSNSEYITP